MLLIKQNIDAFITMKNMNLLLFLKIDYHMFVKSYYSNWSTGRLLCCF